MSRPTSVSKPDDITLLKQKEFHTYEELGALYNVSPETVRKWVSAAKKNREAKHIITLQNLLEHLKLVQQDIDDLMLPAEISDWYLEDDGSQEDLRRKRLYLTSLDVLPQCISKTASYRSLEIEALTHILDNMAELQSVQEWETLSEVAEHETWDEYAARVKKEKSSPDK